MHRKWLGNNLKEKVHFTFFLSILNQYSDWPRRDLVQMRFQCKWSDTKPLFCPKIYSEVYVKLMQVLDILEYLHLLFIILVLNFLFVLPCLHCIWATKHHLRKDKEACSLEDTQFIWLTQKPHVTQRYSLEYQYKRQCFCFFCFNVHVHTQDLKKRRSFNNIFIILYIFSAL